MTGAEDREDIQGVSSNLEAGTTLEATEELPTQLSEAAEWK